MFVVSGVLIVGVVEIARVCLSETVVLEPMIVKGASDGGPTIEMATQQIATYVATIQRTGAREWRTHSFTDADQTFNIQIPGSPLTIDTVVREIVELLPNRRRVVKVSITPDPRGEGHVAAVSILGGRSPKHKTCVAKQEPDALAKMFECVAIAAMSAIDPLCVASYFLSVEEKQCQAFKAPPASPSPIDEIKQRLVDLRKHCDFAKTRSAVGRIIYRDRPDDQQWVSYIYGKLHRARAEALAKGKDWEAQWYEYERAIRRFREFPRKHQPASVKAILMDVYIKNSAVMQESITSLKEQNDGDVIGYRLAKAAKIMKEASEEFDSTDHWSDAWVGLVAAHSAESEASASFVIAHRAAEQAWARFVAGYSSEPRLRIERSRSAALDSHMQGLLLYRQWINESRSRYQGAELGVAVGELELGLLEKANKYFDTASTQARHQDKFYIEWGNTLRALRRFDEAVARYRRAGDISPEIPPDLSPEISLTSHEPLLNIALTLLEKASWEPTTRNLFEAFRHTSNYLTWGGDGVPLTTLADRIEKTLHGALDDSLAKTFASCRSQYVREPKQRVRDTSHTAALKYCVDGAWTKLAKQVVAEAARDRIVNQENAQARATRPVANPQIVERPLSAQTRGTVEVATSR